MNEIAAFFGNYPLLNMWIFLQRFVITSINTSSQSTTCKSKSKKTRKLWPMGNMQIFICPKATPKAMPQAKF
ncbi:hypothetical protein T01_2470 [Trichinella spiralis]|uniref:Uncharacterized protein n=1 Tax=Trichinella spiralis TaxID=6334 RepID=A0A0V1AMK8_TRISP|nr:hypothetical protein T01_2470 [Trichinella spiralis]